MTPEGKVMQHLTRRVKAIGGHARKVTWDGHVGAPDWFVVLHGASAFFELKAPNGRPSTMQLREMEMLRRGGNIVYLCYGVDDVDAAMQDLHERAKRAPLSEGEDATF